MIPGGSDWVKAVLGYNIFEGDFGDGTDRCLVDRIYTAKRRGTCRECLGQGALGRFLF